MMKGKWLWMIALVVTVAAVSSTIFASGQKESGTSAQAAAPKAKTFAIVYPIVHPFFEPVTKEAVTFGKSQDVSIITKATKL